MPGLPANMLRQIVILPKELMVVNWILILEKVVFLLLIQKFLKDKILI